MIHQGDRLPFGFESGDQLRVVVVAADQFKGHAPADWFFLLGEPDRAHSSRAYFFDQTVRSNFHWRCVNVWVEFKIP